MNPKRPQRLPEGRFRAVFGGPPEADAADEADEADEGFIWPHQPPPQLQLAKADLSDPYRGCGPRLFEQLTD